VILSEPINLSGPYFLSTLRNQGTCTRSLSTILCSVMQTLTDRLYGEINSANQAQCLFSLQGFLQLFLSIMNFQIGSGGGEGRGGGGFCIVSQ
jgi:hypothetical protein